MGNKICCEQIQKAEYVSQVKQNINVEIHAIRSAEQNKNRVSASSLDKMEEILSPEKNRSSIEKQINNSPLHIKIVDTIQVPVLNEFITKALAQNKYFEVRKNNIFTKKRYGEEIYEGEFDELGNIPHGFGRMYKNDGSLYIGQFIRGKAQGKGVYLTPNGAIYQGNFHNNCAHGNGKYTYNDTVYIGHFLKNKFHGKGKQNTKGYQFEGQFYQGNKCHGIFKWKDQKQQSYIYTGYFNFKNQFHREGILSDPHGTYQGQFIDGKKSGKGVYKYNNGLRYQGEYSNGLKNGLGIIYNFSNTIAYEGEFKNDMPHGKGFVYDEDGRHECSWVNGIDEKYL